MSRSIRMVLNLLSYPRAVVMVFVGAFYTLFLSVLLVVGIYLGGTRKWTDWVIRRLWSDVLLRMAGLTVEIRGTEHIEASGKGFVLLFNHSSLLDILILFSSFPRSFMFGAKIELFRVPLFGRAMTVAGILPIDRQNRNQAMRVYEKAVLRLNQGECFALAPEGTRQNEARLGKFKRGPFEFARQAQADLIPVVISGVLEALPKHSVLVNMGRWRRRVIVQITPPVRSAAPDGHDLDQVQAQARRQMEDALSRIALVPL